MPTLTAQDVDQAFSAESRRVRLQSALADCFGNNV